MYCGQSSSPLSCSSPSNSLTPQMNISPPVLLDASQSYRSHISDVTANSETTTMSSGNNTKQLTSYGCCAASSIPGSYAIDPDAKSDYSQSAIYPEEPNRKREQRLMKNRCVYSARLVCS